MVWLLGVVVVGGCVCVGGGCVYGWVEGGVFSSLCNVGGPQTNVEVTRHLFHRNMFVGVSNLTFSSKPPSDSRVLSHSLCSFQMGGGFPSGELMLVAQKSQTGSGPDIFSWMNVMLTLSKGFVKRNT